MSDLKLPTRPAPSPPKVDCVKQNGPTSKRTLYDRDPFHDQFKLSRSQSAGKLGETKKPPRPPPPKQKQSSHLLSSIFMRNKPSGCSIPKSQTCANIKRQVTSGGLLIDFSSPPSSPTLTAHSSSDNFSVNSFGSDGLFTNNQVESGFEDDFDLLMLPNTATSNVLDPWVDDPFSSTKQSNQTFSPFELSNEDPRCKHKAIAHSVSTSAKPTIIRPKNSKPARPPPPKLRPSSTPPTFVSLPFEESSPQSANPCLEEWSPPMPNCPPPPPPPEVLETLEHGPSLPPRPSNLNKESLEKKKPYCIALYDYEASHPDDLSFKVNDVIYLKERVNDDWLRGSLKGREGMFPASYTSVVVPLDDETQHVKYVLALFTFRPESWDDLPFQEGETIRVKKIINEHWLFGECNGRQGQFPTSYVTDVSSFLHPS